MCTALSYNLVNYVGLLKTFVLVLFFLSLQLLLTLLHLDVDLLFKQGGQTDETIGIEQMSRFLWMNLSYTFTIYDNSCVFNVLRF